MATLHGAGTEIIRTAMWEDLDGTVQYGIIGVAHHIYTILSLIVRPSALQATTNRFYMAIEGWDAKGAAPAEDVVILSCNPQLLETFVWNDKFSFNGYGPDASAMSGALTTVAEQDAIADQGGAIQKLKFYSDHPDDSYEVALTYIDQNNA